MEELGSPASVSFKQLREDAGIGRVSSGGESREVGMQKQGRRKAEGSWGLTSGSNCCFLLATFWTRAVMVEPGGAWTPFHGMAAICSPWSLPCLD